MSDFRSGMFELVRDVLPFKQGDRFQLFYVCPKSVHHLYRKLGSHGAQPEAMLWVAFDHLEGTLKPYVPKVPTLADKLRENHRPVHRTLAADLLDNIYAQLSGREWDSDTTSAIAELMARAGYAIEEPSE